MKTRYVLLVIAGLIVLGLLAMIWRTAMKPSIDVRVEEVQEGVKLAGTLQQMEGTVVKSAERSKEVADLVAKRHTTFSAPTSDPFIDLLPVEEMTATAPGTEPGTMPPAMPGAQPGTAPAPGGAVPRPGMSTAPVAPGAVPPGPSILPNGQVAVASPGTAPGIQPGAMRPGAPAPAPKEETWPKLRVHGLAISGTDSLAVINNDVYGKDNTLDGLKVVSVSEKGVVLASELGKERELPLEGWPMGGKAK